MPLKLSITFLIFIEIKILVGWETFMIIWQLEINQTVKYTKQTIQVKVMTIPNVRMHEYFCVLNTFTQMLIKFLQKTSCEPLRVFDICLEIQSNLFKYLVFKVFEFLELIYIKTSLLNLEEVL